MTLPEIDFLNNQVGRIFRVEDVTAGNPKEWIARYRGYLLAEDTIAAYDQLADALRPYNITPLFRKEQGGKQVIFLVPSLPIPKVSARWYLNAGLFILTILSAMITRMDIPA